MVQNAQRKIELRFYRAASGKDPVRDWLAGLPVDSRRAIGQDLQRVQYRWPVGMPLVRPLGDGLFEVRTATPDGNAARILFCFGKEVMVMLHGFIKKTRATPEYDLKIARQRKRDVERS